MPTEDARPWPRGPVHFGVARGFGTPRAQSLDVIELETESAQVQLDVLGEGRVAGGEHEAVAADPLGVLGVVAQDALVEGVRQRSQAHGGAGVAGADVLHGIGGENACQIDRPGVRITPVLGVVSHGQRGQFGWKSHVFCLSTVRFTYRFRVLSAVIFGYGYP